MAQITISGIVKDSSNTPLPFVMVTVSYKTQTTIAAYSFTDDKGYFTLKIPKSDSFFTLFAQLIGYKKTALILNYEQGKNNYILDFQLNSEKFSLPTLTIRADKLDKVVRKDTTTFKVKFYIDSTERVVEDVLKKLPGMNVKEDGSLEYKGRPIERILVEGDDLFNGNYKIPSKNLHADLIDEVQVIDRYSSNPLLKNIENSERQIINLNFKKERKKALFGNINAGGGITNRYDANANIISFIQKMKLFSLSGLNNVGNDLGSGGIDADRMLNRFNNPDYYDPAINAPALIPLSRLSTPNLNTRRLNINQTGLASFNFLTRPTEGWALKAIALFSKDRLLQEQNNTTAFLLGSQQFSTNEYTQAVLKPRMQDFHLENTIPLSKNANFKLVNEYKKQEANAETAITLNEKDISQTLTNNSTQWRNMFSLTQRISDSTAIVVEGAYIRDKRPQNLILQPKENYVSLINIPALTFTSLEQNATIFTQYGGIEARLIKAWKGENKFSFKVGASLSEDSTNTGIFTDNAGEKRFFNDTSYTNRVKFSETDMYATMGYGRDFGDFNLNTTISVHNLKTLFSDALLAKNSYDRNWLYVTPRLRAKWAFSNRNSVSATYNYRARFADLDDVLGGYIFTNYRNLNRNVIAPYRVNSHSINLLYRFDNSAKKLDGTFAFIYFKDANARNSRYTFTPFYNLSERFNSARNNETLLLNGEVIKFFSKIDLSVKLQTQHSFNLYYNSIDTGDIAKNTNLNHRYLTQFVSTYSGLFNYITGISWSINRQKTLTNNAAINPKFTQMQTWLKTTWKFNKKFYMTVNNEYNVFQSNQNKSKNSIFTDITGQYEVKSSKLYVYLDIYNVLNVKQFTFTQLDINQISLQNYRLLPRIGLVKVEFRF